MQNVYLAVSEIWMSFILLGILVLYKKSIDKITKYLLWASIVRLVSDAICWCFDGVAGPFYGTLTKISNYLTSAFNDEVLILFMIFMWYQIKKENEKPHFMLIIYMWVATISILATTLNFFFGWFYYIDSNNVYHRGNLYHFTYLSVMIALITIFWFLLYYRKRIITNLKILGWVYIILMVCTNIYEYSHSEFSLQTYAEVFAAIIAFFICEIDVRNDLTAAKEKLEIATKEAEVANHAKTVFLNNMSHDIRTPMNAILGFTKLMDKEIDNKEKMKDYIQKIDNSGEYLLSIINNVLNLARIESGKETVDNVFVALQDSNESVVPLIEAEMAGKKIDFSVTADIKHPYIYADMAKNKQITMNLLSNAIKYTPDGGSVHLDFVELPSDREGYALFQTSVTDTGVGMSEEFQKHIFEEFTREQNTTESKINGTGLGMAIVKKLVDLLGGTIELTSELGKGSTFTVRNYHKIVENPELFLNKKTEVKTPDTPLENKRILLAEDNELNAEIATSILEDLGMTVDCAFDGVDCIDMLCKAPSDYYDLIFMDIQMPNLNGYMATKKIRALPDSKKANIPIIAMTANAFEEDKQNSIKYGMNGHISKPIIIQELIDILKKNL